MHYLAQSEIDRMDPEEYSNFLANGDPELTPQELIERRIDEVRRKLNELPTEYPSPTKFPAFHETTRANPKDD